MSKKRAPGRSLDEWMELVTECRQSGLTDLAHGVMSMGYLPAVFTMQLPVSAKKPARYRIQLEKPALLTLHPINRM